MSNSAVNETGEWYGHKSAKFTTSKRHLPAPEAADNKPHPLFSMGSKRHYDAQKSNEFNWKPSIKPALDKDAPRPDRPQGVKYLRPDLGKDDKPRAERRHVD